MPPRKTYKKRPATRRPRRTTRKPYRKSTNTIGGPQTAMVVQTLPTLTINANQGYVVSVAGIVGDRAQAHAPEYALYKIAKVVYRYKPWFDTFQSTTSGGNGPASVPTLYWKMNRMADAPAAFSVDDLQSLGAKPIRFDDKQVMHSYRPNVLNASASGGSVSGSVKMTPWLNTDLAPDTSTFSPSTTEHYGHFFLVNAVMNGSGATPIGSLDVTIYYEFKNPRVTWGSTGLAQPVVRLLDQVPSEPTPSV